MNDENEGCLGLSIFIILCLIFGIAVMIHDNRTDKSKAAGQCACQKNHNDDDGYDEVESILWASAVGQMYGNK